MMYIIQMIITYFVVMIYHSNDNITPWFIICFASHFLLFSFPRKASEPAKKDHRVGPVPDHDHVLRPPFIVIHYLCFIFHPRLSLFIIYRVFIPPFIIYYLLSVICHLSFVIYDLSFMIYYSLFSEHCNIYYFHVFSFVLETISVRVQRFGLRVDGVGFLRGMRVRALRWRPQGSPRPQSQSRSAYRAYHHLTFSLHLSSIIETSFSFIISFIIYHFSHLSSIVYSSLFIIYYRFSMKNRALSSKHFIMYYFHYSTIFLCD